MRGFESKPGSHSQRSIVNDRRTLFLHLLRVSSNLRPATLSGLELRVMKKLSWEDIEEITDKLADKIKASGFKPDYIVGITTGGLIPLYFLIKKLDIYHILTVSASSYERDQQKELKIAYLPEIDLIGKKLLFVDEITDTGVSLKGVLDAVVNKYKPEEIKTATLVVKTDRCKFYPDFYVVTEQGEWVVFPWEKEEFPEYFK